MITIPMTRQSANGAVGYTSTGGDWLVKYNDDTSSWDLVDKVDQDLDNGQTVAHYGLYRGRGGHHGTSLPPTSIADQGIQRFSDLQQKVQELTWNGFEADYGYLANVTVKHATGPGQIQISEDWSVTQRDYPNTEGIDGMANNRILREGAILGAGPLEGTASDAHVHIDSAENCLTPWTNPDGYEYTPRADNMWRKNRSSADSSIGAAMSSSVGVDVNRFYRGDDPQGA